MYLKLTHILNLLASLTMNIYDDEYECECDTIQCQHNTFRKPPTLPKNTAHILESWILSNIFRDDEDNVDQLMALQRTPESFDYPWKWMDNLVGALLKWATNKTYNDYIFLVNTLMNYKNDIYMIEEEEVIRENSLAIWTDELHHMRHNIEIAFSMNDMIQLRITVNLFLKEFSRTFRNYIPLYQITVEFDAL